MCVCEIAKITQTFLNMCVITQITLTFPNNVCVCMCVCGMNVDPYRWISPS